MPRRQKLSADDFALLLKVNGFTQLRSGDVLDLRAGRSSLTPDRMRPILHGRQTDRQATFDAMIRLRAARDAEQETRTAALLECERIAAAIAPQVLAPCRADLAGPAAVAQLANDFILHTTRSEGAAWSDMISMGWRPEQLREHADAARIVAQRHQEKQTAEVAA